AAIQAVRHHLASHAIPCAQPIPSLGGRRRETFQGRAVEVEPYVAAPAAMNTLARGRTGLPPPRPPPPLPPPFPSTPAPPPATARRGTPLRHPPRHCRPGGGRRRRPPAHPRLAACSSRSGAGRPRRPARQHPRQAAAGPPRSARPPAGARRFLG